jgi:hypothetical protein
LLGLAALQRLSASRAGGARAFHHPMGAWDIERHIAPLRAMLGLRQQGRDDDVSELGRFPSRGFAVSGRLFGRSSLLV